MNKTTESFDACNVCGKSHWEVVYRGSIRDGTFGSLRHDAIVARCGGCGVERLAEEFCTPSSSYEADEYRNKLRQPLNFQLHFRNQDALQLHTLRTIWPTNLRDKTVADIGCGAGSLLDHLSGYTKTQIGVEPYQGFFEGLQARGYPAYRYATDATVDWAGSVDMAFSIQVIEHTPDPRVFLEEIRPLLSADGLLVISTPNRRDILFDLLPEDFPPFFYRVVHRWYFDAQSLENCARMAGYDVVEMHYVHRYGMANALLWLRDRGPAGNERLKVIDKLADSLWAGYLEKIGRADCLFAVLKPIAS